MTKRMPWFRMYADFINDPKMIPLAFEDQRHFIGVLALKCDGAIDDIADGDLLDRIVAQRLWIDHGIIREVKRRLITAGLIDSAWQPIAWEKRQMRSDIAETGAERQKRFRDAKKSNALRNALRNGPVTLPEEDIDIEEEEDISFERAWNDYPDRPGKNKQSSLKAWNARIKAGVDPEVMLQGVVAYAEYCVASRTEPGFIKQPATFFGPDQHFLSDWTAPIQTSAKRFMPGRVAGVKPGDIGEIPDAY